MFNVFGEKVAKILSSMFTGGVWIILTQLMSSKRLVMSAFVNTIKSKNVYESMHMWQGGGVCYCLVFGIGGSI